MTGVRPAEGGEDGQFGGVDRRKALECMVWGGTGLVRTLSGALQKAGGMGNLGPEQLAWLADDLKGKSASTPIVVFAHVPPWTIAADWGARKILPRRCNCSPALVRLPC
jgi:hypothetical protein